jgi:hypothetical protein
MLNLERVPTSERSDVAADKLNVRAPDVSGPLVVVSSTLILH